MTEQHQTIKSKEKSKKRVSTYMLLVTTQSINFL